MKQFDSVQMTAPGKNTFDLSHEKKLTCNMGDLIPIYIQDVLPGDVIDTRTDIFARVAPMLAPIMHRIDVYLHYFEVPWRQIWDEWEDFFTAGGDNGVSAPVFPQLIFGSGNIPEFQPGTLADYIGIPTNTAGTITAQMNVSALPFRAYQEIYNEYYRDQNLINKIPVSHASGISDAAQITAMTTLRKRAWAKDYFTSCLPFAQRGDEVLIPMEGEADIVYREFSNLFTDSGAGGTVSADGFDGIVVNTEGARIENLESVTLANGSITINELRVSVRLQEFLEIAARAGSRYTEQIRAHFGVISSDARIQRPIYLGGGKQKVVISEVLSTYQDPEAVGEPQGNMAGHGIVVGHKNGFHKRFEEHGTVIGIMSILPKAGYSQGLSRHLQKFDLYDHYFPKFANLGEQEVLNKELYFDSQQESTNNATFGYQSRYAEYKYVQNSTHGEFKTTQKFWHMDRLFTETPYLQETFISADPTHRIFPVTDPAVHKMYIQVHHKVKAVRPIPYFNVPTI